MPFKGLALLVPLVFSWVVTCEAAEPLQIQAVNVRMFLQYSGEFSPSLAGKEVLWNVVAGGGDILEPASAALVDVLVSGKENGLIAKKDVQLIVKSGRTGKVLIRERERLGIFNSSGETHVGFWLPSIGCESLIVVASIEKSSKIVTLPFKCGE